MPKVKVNDIKIEYSIDGAGEPLLLIAGLGYNRWCWHRVIPELSKTFQVITFDNRGVGGTDRTPGPYSSELLAKDTADLLDTLGFKKAHIAGISMGGFIAQALVIQRPDLFKSLILMSTGFGGARQVPAEAEVMSQLINPTLSVRDRCKLSCAPDFSEREKDFFESWVKYRTENPVNIEGYRSQLAVGLKLMYDENSFESALSSVQIPTLILYGELDRVIPAGNGALLQNAIPNSQLVLIPEVSHFLPFECPQIIVSQICSFKAHIG